MRINSENKTMDMEARDINYILPAYVRSYLFYSKNEMPEKIIFPMFASVRAAGVDIPIEWVPPLEAVAVEIAKDGDNVAEVTPEQEVVLDEKDEEIKRLKAEVAALTPAPEDLIRQQEETATPTDVEEEIEVADRKFREENPEDPEPTEDEIIAGLVPPPSPAKTAFAETAPKAGDSPGGNAPFTVTPDRIPKQPPGGDIGPGQPLSDMHARDRKDQIQTAKDLVEESEIEGAPEKPFEKTITRDEDGKPIVEDNPSAID